MQIQLHNIGSGERLLWKIGEEEFVDDARTRDAHRALLLVALSRGHHHPTQYPRRSHWDLRAIIEAAHRLTFWALLKLIGRQMQTRLNERMIEGGIFFAAGNAREVSHIGEHSPRAILSVESKQGARLWKLMCCEIARDRRQALTQFLPIPSVSAVSKRPEPLMRMGLEHGGASPNGFSAFAPGVARSAHLIQPAQRRGQLVALGQGALAGRLPRPIDVKDDPAVPNPIREPARLLVGREGTTLEILEKECAQGIHRCLSERSQKAGERRTGRQPITLKQGHEGNSKGLEPLVKILQGAFSADGVARSGPRENQSLHTDRSAAAASAYSLTDLAQDTVRGVDAP